MYILVCQPPGFFGGLSALRAGFCKRWAQRLPNGSSRLLDQLLLIPGWQAFSGHWAPRAGGALECLHERSNRGSDPAALAAACQQCPGLTSQVLVTSTLFVLSCCTFSMARVPSKATLQRSFVECCCCCCCRRRCRCCCCCCCSSHAGTGAVAG